MSDNEQRNENRETVSDIVAEMRERADAMQTHGTTHGVRLAVLEFARRIEAAWKREARAIATENAVLPAMCITKPSGNAAAMREALVTAKKAICHHAEYVCERLACKNGNTQSNCIIMLCAHRDLCEAKTAINAALSAPARNCDLNLSEKSLWDKFEDYMHDCGLPFYSEPSGEDAFGWLLAPAKKRKGDGDATI